MAIEVAHTQVMPNFKLSFLRAKLRDVASTSPRAPVRQISVGGPRRPVSWSAAAQQATRLTSNYAVARASSPRPEGSESEYLAPVAASRARVVEATTAGDVTVEMYGSAAAIKALREMPFGMCTCFSNASAVVCVVLSYVCNVEAARLVSTRPMGTRLLCLFLIQVMQRHADSIGARGAAGAGAEAAAAEAVQLPRAPPTGGIVRGAQLRTHDTSRTAREHEHGTRFLGWFHTPQTSEMQP